jgi:hypothetical protein
MENLLRGDSDDRLGKKLKPGWKAGGNQVANKAACLTVMLLLFYLFTGWTICSDNNSNR